LDAINIRHAHIREDNGVGTAAANRFEGGGGAHCGFCLEQSVKDALVAQENVGFIVD
jgi:hypothetical protein